MELFTDDNTHVASVWPMEYPTGSPNDVVFWGARVFRKNVDDEGNEWWTETPPMVVVEMELPESLQSVIRMNGGWE